MQAAETVCLWNYQFKKNNNNNNSPPSMSNNMSPSINDSHLHYLPCSEQHACESQMGSKAMFYCLQCRSLQCVLCENAIHSKEKQHERLNLDEIDELCSIDRRHQAVFFCPSCEKAFCFTCFDNHHRHPDGRTHRPNKGRQQSSSSKKINGSETKPIKIVSSSSKIPLTKMASFSFEDIKVDDNDEYHISPSNRSKSKECEIQNGVKTLQSDQTNTESDRSFLLLDANEHLTLNDEFEFLRRLRCTNNDLNVKCVSIIGNTGDGKSYTLNEVFFGGEEVFPTSTSADSCTMGIWAALDENSRTLVLDTEGRLGLTSNDNIRNRLLLKILCISDVVIFRTRAPKLPNDMFQFLSEASNSFLKFFQRELEHVMKSCKADGPVSSMGPTLIVYHETQHTEVLRDHFQCQKTAVEQLKERFEKMGLSYGAYSSIEYVGIQTMATKQSDFSEIKATIAATLENNNIRSRRRLSVIFKTLKALNEKFNHKIPPAMPSTFPDELFTCWAKCLACGSKCIKPANHQKENPAHECNQPCAYSKDLDNEVWKCLQCYRERRDTIVPGKLMSRDDGLMQGLVKYAWLGYLIECPHHGEIYRSRKHWYGNTEPKDVTRTEIIHVWSDDDNKRLKSDVTPRKIRENIMYVGSYLAAPTKMAREWVADSVAPAYWKPNKDVMECSLCKLVFGLEYSKHHCRACGHVFCDTCTAHRRIVPWVDSETPVRVCDNCYENPRSHPPSCSSSTTTSEKCSDQRTKIAAYDTGSSGDSTSPVSSGEHLSDLCLTPTDIFDIEQPGAVAVDIPTSWRVYGIVKSSVEKLANTYPVELIKESTRPGYWRPDNECRACFICKRSFNNTSNRLHHCRNCGDCVCEHCSPIKRPVPERDWLTPVRVCNYCDRAMNEGNEHK